jgi:hypothetical protein
MVYDIKILQGLADLTLNWKHRREDFFKFACASDDPRWQEPHFRDHMYLEYIKTDTPITARLYSLDAPNQRTLLRYIDERLMDGMASLEIEC